MDYERIVSHLKTWCNIAPSGTALEHTSEEKGFEAIWDTGASMTAISRRVADSLSLTSGRTITVNTIAGRVEKRVYNVDIMLPGGIAIPNVKVNEGDMAGVDVLIGMDVISLGSFAISNHNGKTIFSFEVPSRFAIDFTQKKKISLWNRLFIK